MQGSIFVNTSTKKRSHAPVRPRSTFGFVPVLLLAALAFVTGCDVSQPTATLAEIDWSQGELPDSVTTRVDDEYGTVIEVAGKVPRSGPGSLELFAVNEPGIPGVATTYWLEGSLSYEDVPDHAYLEMWSTFPDGRSYFSRTLADKGPLGKIEGDSSWRVFRVPFSLGNAAKDPHYRPVRITFGIRSPGGTVSIGAVQLKHY